MVIKTNEWDNLSNPTKGYIETALIKGMTSPSTMIISAANLTQSVLQQYYLSCNQATISTNTISLYHKSGADVNIFGIASNLKIQSTLTSSGTIELIADNIKFRKFTGAPNYYLDFPVGKSGTVALTSDIPNKTYLHNITVSYQKYTWFTFNLLSSSSTPLTTVSAIVGAARGSGVFKCGCFGWDMTNSGTASGDIHFLNSVTFSSYAGTLSLYFSYQLFFDKSAGTMSVNSFATTDYVLSSWSINDNVSTYL